VSDGHDLEAIETDQLVEHDVWKAVEQKLPVAPIVSVDSNFSGLFARARQHNVPAVAMRRLPTFLSPGATVR
jgi:hypothetical protein